jgi:hypothetical protein
MWVRLIGIFTVMMVIVSIFFECYHKRKVISKEAFAVRGSVDTQKKQSSYVSADVLKTVMKSVTTRFAYFTKQLEFIKQNVNRIDDIDARVKKIEADMNQDFT